MSDYNRMRFPELHTGEPRRQYDRRVALTRAAAREAEHARVFGERAATPPSEVVVRSSARGLTMPFGVFRVADYGQLCKMLGLRPSAPRASAQSGRHKTSA